MGDSSNIEDKVNNFLIESNISKETLISIAISYGVKDHGTRHNDEFVYKGLQPITTAVIIYDSNI